MIKKILILGLILVFFLGFFKKDNYQIKIELKTKNLSAGYIDENIVNPLKEELLNISEIKDIVSFSHFFGADIYVKVKNKTKTYIEIEQKVCSFLYKNSDIKSYKINKNYDLRYDYFFIVYDYDYFELKNKADEIYSELLKMRGFKDVKILGEQQIINSIYFKYENLRNFNLDIKDIKKMIRKNNLNFDEFNSDFKGCLNGNIQSIEDLAQIEIPFKNSNFSLKFSDIFEIKKEIKELSEGRIFYSDKSAIVFALSKKGYFLNYFKINSLKNNYGGIFEKINKRKKIEIFLDENNISKTREFYKKIEGKNLYFLGLNTPNNDKFDYNRQDRIIAFCNKKEYSKLKKYLIENNVSFLDKSYTFYFSLNNLEELKNKLRHFGEYANLGTSKALKPHYNFNFNNLAKFQLSKEDIINSILAYKEGLILDKYKTLLDDIEIVLKNREKSNFIYSKKYQNLFDINFFLTTSLKDDFDIIARKNFDYLGAIKIKNPSIFRRVEFRYLLSL